MRSKLYYHINNLLLPCLFFSLVTGFFTAIITTTFKIMAEWVIHASNAIYAAVRSHPVFLPLLVLGAAVTGLIASVILSKSDSCKGGGIPTSVAAVHGIFSFRWLESILLLPISALITFLAGLPLGTEGPCVQMGTAVGDGVISCLGWDKNKGWRRYIMLGGASAGFSIATASPISAIIFSMEEIHKRFSPMILTVVSVSVISAQFTSRTLASAGIGDGEFFSIPVLEALSPNKLFIPLIIGIVCGICSMLFMRLYHVVDHSMRRILKRLSVKIILPVLFAAVSVVGFFFADTLGTGHSLVATLLSPGSAWYVLILLFLIRAIGTMVSNTSGATGGVFLPTLAFGAIIGSVCADALISLGWIGAEHYTLMVVLGITSFLSSTSRIPLTACVFAIEALSGINNVLPIIIATTVSMLILESSGIEDLTDTIINAKLHKITKGKRALHVEVPLTVCRHSFAAGKELKDIIWPNSCVVVSFDHADNSRHHFKISDGDIITVRYVTYDPAATARELCELVGEQSEETVSMMKDRHLQ